MQENIWQTTVSISTQQISSLIYTKEELLNMFLETELQNCVTEFNSCPMAISESTDVLF